MGVVLRKPYILYRRITGLPGPTVPPGAHTHRYCCALTSDALCFDRANLRVQHGNRPHGVWCSRCAALKIAERGVGRNEAIRFVIFTNELSRAR
jgi:hypothetical protein